ncbi:MAG: GTP-binding protein [Alphaproteobacteria bacterium]|nr:GTP-binding protein [Alphaproteobacteria bacterium]
MPPVVPFGPSRIPVTVLTGSLGAGKTTLLARLLALPALADTALIINEFGAVGLDHRLLDSADERLVTLAGGCVCCTVRSDLGVALDRLFQRRVRATAPFFRRVIIETTGLADPAPVLQAIIAEPLSVARYRLAGLVAVIDGIAGAAALDARPEAVKQAAIADRLVLSKADLALPAALDALEARLAALNPAAPRIRAGRDSALDPAWFLADAPGPPRPRFAAAAPASPDAPAHEAAIHAVALALDAPLPPERVEPMLADLARRFGADLLRLKAIVALADDAARPVALHAVQHRHHPPERLPAWPDAERRSLLVAILRGVPADAFRAAVAAFAPARILSG